jgi:LPXTG-motif cell wall-anchored protein
VESDPPTSGAAAAAKPEPQRDADAPTAVAAAPGSVTIADFSFGPSAVTVGVGESVTWRNDGPSEHSATASDGSFDTGLLGRGESGSATFGEAGTFGYICTPHPFMKGTVRVVAQSAGDDGAADGLGGTGITPGGGSSTAGTASQADGTSLPSTGAEPGWLAVTGLGLLLIGASGMRRTARGTRR